MRLAAVLVSVVALISCAPSGSDTPKTIDESPVAVAPAPVAPTLVAWYETQRALDLTGDGMLDTLVLHAHGPSPDSLTVVLNALIDGDTVPLDVWKSSYELAIAPDSVQRPGAARDAFLRANFDATLADARTKPFADSTLDRAWIPRGDNVDCMVDVHDCIMRAVERELGDSTALNRSGAAAFDTARAREIIADLRTPGRLALVYSYGYESTVERVWSPITRRFYAYRFCC